MLKKFLFIALLLGISGTGMGMLFGGMKEYSYSYSEKCPENKPFFDGKLPYWSICSLLPDGTEDKECLEKNQKAEEDHYDKHCFSCKHDKPMLILKGHEKDFERCPNRVTFYIDNYYITLLDGVPVGYSGLKKAVKAVSVLKKECPLDKPLLTIRGNCVACNELSGQIIQDCSACPNTMMSISGRCYSCDTNAIAGFPKEECQKCSDTRWFSQDTIGWAMHVNFCMPKKSSIEGRPLMAYGEVTDSPLEDTYFIRYETCDTPEIIKTDRETCDLCPGRIFTGNYCVLKDSPLGEKCERLETVFAPKEVCDLCPNRMWNNRRCTVSECPAEAPMRNKWGDCEACGASHTVEKASDCDACPYMKAGQVKDYYFCELDCPAEKPLKTRKGCKSCDDDYVIMYDQDTCALCPNRKYVDGKCVLKKENE
jgi:hypothetical protein